ncbi:rhodanese-like domain-containing protein, partial [Elizabethkingia meningoseptica]|uniref:rhodanese-like domain-containing protein n=1 Tax=Elizabethkingia meningoseptica TaxID=238 RepID=UPI0023B10906
TVYPAHGAGSACGKNMQKETVDSLGNQKRTNYALNQPDKAAFVQEVTDGLTPPPGYFAMNVAMNKKGYESFDHVLLQGSRSLSPEEFEKVAEETGALILDTRPNETFVKSFIPQSVNIGLNGDFAPWVGTLIADVKQSILLVTDEGTTEEAITRLSRVGFDHVVGYLKGGVAAWQEAGKETDNIHRITAEEFAQNYTPESKIIDVRKEGEYSAEHVEDAYSRPLAYINNWIKDIDPKEHFFLHCAGGYRSMIAASILQARGYRNFTEIEGGFKAVKTTIIPVTDFVCQSKI